MGKILKKPNAVRIAQGNVSLAAEFAKVSFLAPKATFVRKDRVDRACARVSSRVVTLDEDPFFVLQASYKLLTSDRSQLW